MYATSRIIARVTLAGLVLVSAAVLDGCREDERAGPLGRAPALTVISLTDRAHEHDAVRRGPEAAGARARELLVALDGAELSAWSKSRENGGTRFESPTLGPDGVPEAGTLRIRLVPGGATRIAVVPHARETRAAREERALRRIDLSLERDAAPDVAVEVSVDLHEALHANLGDTGRSGRLEKLELILPGADADRAVLESLSIERHSPLPAGQDTALRIADDGGVLRPSWVLRGGARVEIPLRVPEEDAELRWWDAALPGTGARRIEIVDEAGSEDGVALAETMSGQTGTPWAPHRTSLSRFAGREVRIRLSVDGDGAGVGLFGSPSVVAGTDTRAPDVLLYLIDTLRADHLGFAARERPPVSPTLDRLAREGVWFRRAQSSSPWTKPAIVTLFSGILPTTHQVGARSYTDRMPDSVPLVQEAFGAAGWRTGSFSASPLGSTLSALERGFDAAYPPRFWRDRPQLGMNPSAEQLHEALLDWVREEPDRPFFAYLHTLEVHEWKLARYQGQRPAGFSAYDAAILDADRQLAKLLAQLAEMRRDRDLVVVVVSDHGESWGDHGLPSHGFGLYQSQIHIPLVLWKSGAGLEPRVVETPVSLADLGPTLLEGFGLPPLEEEVDGRALGALLRGDEIERGPVLSALLRFVWAPEAPRQYAVTTPEQVVRIRKQGGPDRSYDLLLDPQETSPLPEPARGLDDLLDELLAQQRKRADAFQARHGPIATGAVTADESARLRALGYLEGEAPGGLESEAPGGLESEAPGGGEKKNADAARRP